MSSISAWIADAAYIDDSNNFSEELLHSTIAIDKFLNEKKKYFIAGTKGYGKTFLLKIKSIRLRNKEDNALFIPKDDLVDKIGAQTKVTLGRNIYKEYNEIDNHSLLWESSIVISIIKNNQELLDSVFELEEKYPVIKDIFILKEISHPIVQDIYYDLLHNFNLFRQIVDGGLIGKIKVILRNFQKSIYIFIDNVDEYYDKQDIYSEDMWFSSQIALFETVSKLNQSFKRLHIYVTIRKKVLEKMANKNILYGQYKQSVILIKYVKNDLRDIFINNIKVEDKERLKKADIRKSNPIKALVGYDEMRNEFIQSNVRENVFDYIYRHTLGRPRDLMHMGSAIAELRKEYDNEEDYKTDLRNTINNLAYENGEQYIKELRPFIHVDLEKIYDKIDTNILTLEDLQVACCAYNNSDTKDCQNCENIHIFCMLYSQGLLGIEKYDKENNRYYQYFITSGEQPLEDINHMLPQSELYFIHPALSEIIEEHRKNKNKNDSSYPKYRYNTEIIVGYGNKSRLNN